MNLFWKRLFGKLMSTEKFEEQLTQRKKDVERYLSVEQSVELAEYKELAQIVDSEEFKNKKEYFTKKKYKDSDEYKTQQEFLKLKNNSDLQLYFQTLESEELKEFLKFKESVEYNLLLIKEELSKNPRLKVFKDFENSKAYKNYLVLHNTQLPREYEHIKKTVDDKGFQRQLDFWANTNRWETREEYQVEKRFNELALSADISFYLKQNPQQIERYSSEKECFIDDFSWNSLASSSWEAGYPAQGANTIEGYSLTNELQANNLGKNISTSNTHLTIRTKQERVKARAWDLKKGFIEKEFDYSADLLQTKKAFCQKQGIFQAKLRCSGDINHCFWLGAKSKFPLVKIFHYDGKKVLLGLVDEKSADQVQIKGLNPNDFHIYTIEWTEKEILWSINNLVVHRIHKHLPQEKMYLAFSSFISQKQTPSEALFEIDWVRVCKKQA